jgi:hypothetical protein
LVGWAISDAQGKVEPEDLAAIESQARQIRAISKIVSLRDAHSVYAIPFPSACSA